MSIGIAREDRGGVRLLTINRPDKRNALRADMYIALADALEDAARDAAIAVILLAGAGPDFCAGNDIADFVPGGDRGAAAFRFIRAIAAFDKPIVAAVQGLAIGVGTTMLLHCDLVYAAPDARFLLPFAQLGLVPEAGSSLLLPQRIGQAKAAAMLLLGEPLDAAGADHAGLVTAIVAEDVAGHALAKAQALTRVPRAALATTRALMRGDQAAIMARIDREAQAFAAALASPEARAILQAFLDRGRKG